MKGLSHSLFICMAFLLLAFNSYAQQIQIDNNFSFFPVDSNYKVTLVDIGTLRCVPCIKMQPVLDSIKNRYSTQVNVLFYNIGTKEGKENAKQIEFGAIPVQVFFNKAGKEIYRHEGFFSEQEIETFLLSNGVNKNIN
jgi:thioredoxin 1